MYLSRVRLAACVVPEKKRKKHWNLTVKKAMFFGFVICLHVRIKHKNLHVFTLKLRERRKKQSNGRKKPKQVFFSHHSLTHSASQKQNYHMRDLCFFPLFLSLFCEHSNSTFFFFFISFLSLISVRMRGLEREINGHLVRARECARVFRV